MRMAINNTTGYPTPVLRKILKVAARQVGVRRDKTVRVIYARHADYISGWGWYGDRENESIMRTIRSGRYTCHVLLRIPKPKYCTKSPSELALELGAVAAHEFMHNLGVRHKDMTREQRYCEPTWAERWGSLQDVDLRHGTEEAP